MLDIPFVITDDTCLNGACDLLLPEMFIPLVMMTVMLDVEEVDIRVINFYYRHDFSLFEDEELVMIILIIR